MKIKCAIRLCASRILLLCGSLTTLFLFTTMGRAVVPVPCPLLLPDNVKFNVTYNNSYFCSPNGNSYFDVTINGVSGYRGWCSDSVADIYITHPSCTEKVCGVSRFWPADSPPPYSGTVIDSLRLLCPSRDLSVSPFIYQPGPNHADDCVWNQINYLLNKRDEIPNANGDAFQAAVWYLISTPDTCALGTLPTIGLPAVQNAVQALLGAADTAEAKSFIPGPGKKRAALLYVNDQVQFVFVEIDCPCETAPPVFTQCPRDIDLGCNPPNIPDCDLNQVAATDDSGIKSITCAKSDAMNGCLHIRTITYTATDNCGNTASCIQTITWKEDTTPPAPPAPPADVNGQCDSDVPAPVALTATDNCDGPITVSPVDSAKVADTSGCGYTIVRTWTFVDTCGNPSSVWQKIHIKDTTAPVPPAAPADVEGQCDNDVPAAGTLTATDNCDGAITVSPVDSPKVPDASGCGYTITRTWTFTDKCGNSSNVAQKIHIKDTTNPVAPAAPADVEGQCDSDVPAPGTLTATDNCDGAITVSPVDAAPVKDANGCGYTIIRTWTFTDKCGNTASVSQKIHVQDTTAPVPPAAPADFNGQCDSDVPAAGTLTATDNCDGAITVLPVDGSKVQDASGCGYTVVRTWTFTDKCGNTSSVSQNIHIKDTTAPIPPASPVEVNGQCDSDVPASISLTATDNCDGAITVSPADGPKVPDASGCGYTITRTWTFTDKCGNTSSVSQKIHIKDTTAPVPPAAPADVNGQCDGDVPAPVNLTATDNCDGAITASPLDSAKAPDASGCGYTITRTWTFTDKCGNTSSVSQKIHIKDTTAPVPPAAPADFNGQCDSDVPAPVSLTAPDNCDGAITASPLDGPKVPDASGCGYTITRTWTFTDKCGNTSSVSQKIHIKDTTAPVPPVAPADINGQCDSDVPAPVKLTAMDNCDGAITTSPLDSAKVPDASGCGYTITRTWTFTDTCGNTSSVSQKIHIKDTTAPVIICPNDITVGDVSEIPSKCGSAKATDNCDSAPRISYKDDVTQKDCGLVICRTWTATDACGNTATCKQIITIPGKSSLCGYVLRDCDANGNLSGEAGLSGWTVILKKSNGDIVATTITGDNGGYCFNNLSGGTYTVVVIPQPDYALTFPAGCNHKTAVTLGDCQNKTGINFGYTGTRPGVQLWKTGPATAKCGDTITFHFKVKNTGNTCLYGGIQVLDPLLGGEIWHKTPVVPGEVNEFDRTYVVKQTDPALLCNKATAVGHPPFNLGIVTDDSTWNVQITPCCTSSICGSVVQDCDSKSSPVLAGWAITLKNGNGTSTLATTTTDNNGCYCFNNLAAGTYTVVVTPKADYKQTSDPDASKDDKTCVTVGACQSKTGVKFVYCKQKTGCGSDSFWKSHSEEWPCQSITICGKTYTKSEACSLLGSGGSDDKSCDLFNKLLAAKLNVLCGNDANCVAGFIAGAEAWCNAYKFGSKVSGNSFAWTIGSQFFSKLDDYNNGRLCSPRRD